VAHCFRYKALFNAIHIANGQYGQRSEGVLAANGLLKGVCALGDRPVLRPTRSGPAQGQWSSHNESFKFILYREQNIRIEVKSLQTNSIRYIHSASSDSEGYQQAKVQVDASDRREVTFPNGETLSTTCLLVGDFDLLAVNLFAFENKWHFAFAKNDDLPRSKYKKYSEDQRQFLLASAVTITWPLRPPFYEDPLKLLDEIVLDRQT
jgi:hypothetical protein